MRARIGIRCASAFLVLGGLVACSSAVPQPTRQTSSEAEIDWDQASITLPLDSFGMTSEEQRLARTAQSVIWAKCVTGSNEVSQTVIQEARRGLRLRIPDPDATHWLFGVWNEKFVADHGWLPFPNGGPVPTLLDPGNPATKTTCGKDPDLRSLDSVTISGSDSIDPLLANLAFDSYEQTLRDSRYQQLLGRRASCLMKLEYKVDRTSGLARVDLNSKWSDQAKQVAMLAEAHCDDALQFTPAAASIMASIQSSIINSNFQALERIRALVQVRVAKAREILKEVGI